MEGLVLNVCEIFAKDQDAAEEARKAWNTRTITLDLMYDYIPGLMKAELETKNYIYDALLEKVKALY